MTKDEMVRWHYRSIEMSLSRLRKIGDGQGSLGCCSPCGLRESDKTEQLN